MIESVLIFPADSMCLAAIITALLIRLTPLWRDDGKVYLYCVLAFAVCSGVLIISDLTYGKVVQETYTPVWTNVKERQMQHSPTHRTFTAEQEVTCRWQELVSYRWVAFGAKYEKVDHEGVNCSQLRVIHEDTKQDDDV